MPEGKPREVKVVLLGHQGVGKSSIVLRFVTNNFRQFSESTIGASYMSKLVVVDEKAIKFQIWDTAGQEKYHSLAPMYYRNAAAAVLVYDITKASTFKTLQNWVYELEQRGPKEIALAIVGNKADLSAQREVEQKTAREYAEEIGGVFLEPSAKNNEGIADVFREISRILPAYMPQEGATLRPSLAPPSSNNNSRSNEGGCGC